MIKSIPSTEELIAPCGMNCALCSRYLAGINKLKCSSCTGCRSRGRECTYLFKKCTGINHGKTYDFTFCYECDQYPCKETKRMDKRYRKFYNMSVMDNLEYIRQAGINEFIHDQLKKHTCPRCGGMISINNRKCFKCDTITRLVEKERI
jgi:hypothetical protein